MLKLTSISIRLSKPILNLVGPVHVVGGLLVFVTGFSPAAQEILQSLFTVSDDFVWSLFFLAILGPTIASWGVLFGALVKQFYRSPTTALWRAMLLSVVVWAPLDTVLCLKYGLYGGAILNGIVFASLVLLLVSARSSIE